MKATTVPADYAERAAASITVHALKENRRPIGFAREWPEEKPKPKRKPATRRKSAA